MPCFVKAKPHLSYGSEFYDLKTVGEFLNLRERGVKGFAPRATVRVDPGVYRL